MKLFHDPASCSIGIRIILEESAANYETVFMALADGDQHKSEFRQINPKGKVPALILDDGSTLTEFQAIAFWLGASFPQSGLLPEELEEQARCLELMDFVVSTLHMRGATLGILPMKFTQNEQFQAEIRLHGEKVVADGLKILSEKLGDHPYFMGNALTIADCAVYYLLRWEGRCKMDIPENLLEFRNRMRERPAVKRAETPGG